MSALPASRYGVAGVAEVLNAYVLNAYVLNA